MTADTIAPTATPDVFSLHIQENVTFLNDGKSSKEQERTTESPLSVSSETAKEGAPVLEGPHSRFVGDTEHNWCRAVASGTGVTVLAFLFSRGVDGTALQQAVELVQERHPRLRSSLVWIHGRPAFQVAERPCVTVDIVDSTLSMVTDPDVEECATDLGHIRSEDDCTEQLKNEGDETSGTANLGVCPDTSADQGDEDVSLDDQRWSTADLQDGQTCEWMNIVEAELNVNVWPEQENCSEPTPMFAVRLHLLRGNRSLVIVRVHTAVCDRVGAATVVLDMMRYLHEFTGGCARKDANAKFLDGCEESRDESQYLGSIEGAIPPGQANKPFWAHGIDLLGYSLGSKRHALVPFDEPHSPRNSKFFHCTLHAEKTKQLQEACERRNVNLHGALTAAGMKAAAAIKSLDRKSEHFAIISLVNCRQLLEPQLSESSVGFYHSAVLNTHHVNEYTDFWDLAERSCSSLKNSVKNRKHFTDMGDLNYLMYQALQHPNLTPYSSMRTSLLVAFKDTMQDDTEELREALGVEHYLGCSSIHGVGPTLAIFDSIRQGALHFSAVYASPLYSRDQIQKYVQLMVDFVVEALDA